MQIWQHRHPLLTRGYWRRNFAWVFAWPVLCLGLLLTMWGSQHQTKVKEANGRPPGAGEIGKLAQDYADRLRSAVFDIQRGMDAIALEHAASKGSSAQGDGPYHTGCLPELVSSVTLADSDGIRHLHVPPCTLNSSPSSGASSGFPSFAMQILLTENHALLRLVLSGYVTPSLHISADVDANRLLSATRPPALPEGAHAFLFSRDGTLLAPRHMSMARPGRNTSFSDTDDSDGRLTLKPADASQHPAGNDPDARQPVVDLPLVIALDSSPEDVRAQTIAYGMTLQHFATWAIGALLSFGAIATGLTVCLTLRHHREQEEREAYRLATEGSQESFYLLRALFNARGEIVDFRLIDCNQSAAALFGLKREKFLGATVSSFYQGDYFRRMMDIYLHAMDKGVFEDEYRVPRDSPLVHSQWLHRRFVRSGINLAMTVRDITDAKLYQHQLLRMANEDALTRLPNRHWLMGYLPEALHEATRQGTMLALFFIDLDGFKAINDTHGHAAGDAVLNEVAARMTSMLRSEDRAVRLGGDEFMFLIEQVRSIDLLVEIAKRATESLNQPVPIPGATAHVGASIGISVFPHDGTDGETLLINADRAMYVIKNAGKGSFCFYSDIDGSGNGNGNGKATG